MPYGRGRVPAIYAGDGLLYGVGLGRPIRATANTQDERLRVGGWYWAGEDGTIVDAASAYLPTTLNKDIVLVNCSVACVPPRKGCPLDLAYSTDFDEWIFIPDEIDLSGLDYDVNYKLDVTPMTEREMDFYERATGQKAQWKMHAVAPGYSDNASSDKRQTAKAPSKRKPTDNGNNDKVKVAVVRRLGIVVGASACKRILYVWTPEEPLEMDGKLVCGEDGERVEVGDWIKFTVDKKEADSIFRDKTPARFNVLEYKKTEPLFDTHCTRATIELRVTDYRMEREERSSSSSPRLPRGVVRLIHDDLGFMVDPEQLTRSFKDGSPVELLIRREGVSQKYGTIWVVRAASAAGENSKPGAVLSRATAKESRKMRAVAPSESGASSRLASSKDSTETKRAFVTGVSDRTAYLWVADDVPPRRSSIIYAKAEREAAEQAAGLKVGQWIRGTFRRHVSVADKRRPKGAGGASDFSYPTEWSLIDCPPDIDTSRCRDMDGFRMIVVRTNVAYSVSHQGLCNKYIGDQIFDLNGLVPKDAIDGEIFSAVLTLSRTTTDSHHFHWTLERLDSAEATPRVLAEPAKTSRGARGGSSRGAREARGARASSNRGAREGGGARGSSNRGATEGGGARGSSNRGAREGGGARGGARGAAGDKRRARDDRRRRPQKAPPTRGGDVGVDEASTDDVTSSSRPELAEESEGSDRMEPTARTVQDTDVTSTSQLTEQFAAMNTTVDRSPTTGRIRLNWTDNADDEDEFAH